MELASRLFTDRVSETKVRAVAPILGACAAMLYGSLFIYGWGGLSPLPLVLDYAKAAAGIVLTSVLLWVWIRIARLAPTLADRPLAIAWAELKPRLPWLIVPLAVLPVFMASFTAAKTSIPIVVGYRFDAGLAAVDAALFGTDPWRLTHRLFGRDATEVIAFFYVTGWITLFAYTKPLIALFGSERTIRIFFTAMLATWFVGGFLGAYAFASAGPIFAHLADPAVAQYFLPLKERLAATLSPGSPLVSGPAYLEWNLRSGGVVAGGGISAMPSMHVAEATLYVLAARGTRLFWLAIAFAGLVVIGSVHSGYHYAVDAPIAVLIAILCWKASEQYYAAGRSGGTRHGLPR